MCVYIYMYIYIYMYTYNWVTLLYSSNWHNIVIQFDFNNKYFFFLKEWFQHNLSWFLFLSPVSVSHEAAIPNLWPSCLCQAGHTSLKFPLVQEIRKRRDEGRRGSWNWAVTSDQATMSPSEHWPSTSTPCTRNIEAFSQPECPHFTLMPLLADLSIEIWDPALLLLCNNCIPGWVTESWTQELRVWSHFSHPSLKPLVQCFGSWRPAQWASNCIHKKCNCSDHFLCPFEVPRCSY